MEKFGLIKYSYKKCRTVYKYGLKFEQPTMRHDFRDFAALTEQDRVETDVFTFDSGILNKTDHAFKAYFFINSGNVFLKVQMGEPKLEAPYTHSKIMITNINCLYQHFFPEPFTRATDEQVKSRFFENEFDFSTLNETWWAYKNENDFINILSPIEIIVENNFWADEKIVATTKKTDSVPADILPQLTTLDTVSMYHNKEYCDFIILCGDRKFAVHKIVLASRSEVFASMLQHRMLESLEGKVEISDAEPKVMEEFIRFLYTGTASVEDVASELILLAEKYSIDNLKAACETHLIKTITEETVWDLYTLATSINLKKLAANCIEFLKRNRKEMMKTSEDIKMFAQNHPELAYTVLFD